MGTAQNQPRQIQLVPEAHEDVEEGQKPKKKKFKDVQIINEGTQIVLPEGMGPADAIQWLHRKMEEDERVVAIHEKTEAFVLEGAYALARAISRVFGFSSLVPTPGMFGDDPPSMVGMEVAVGETVQVPWGRMQVPGLSGWIGTSWNREQDGRVVFVIVGEVRRKHETKVKEIAALTRQIIREESVYRGQAFRVKFQDPNERPDPTICPKFIDISRVREGDLLFSADVQSQVTASLFTPIEKTTLCRKHKVPLKRGILLEGPYGTGKTLTAYVTAKKAVNNGWTFIYLDDISQIKQAILFAQMYQPAVIFAEDVDQVVGDQDRDEETNEILNTIDGVLSKDSEVMVVLTTNHVETINKAMLRPGRLDAVISVRPPDALTVERLIRLYARGLVHEHENLREVGQLMAGNQPASIREVVERAKLASMAHLSDEDELHLTAHDLEIASKSLLGHLELLNEETDKELSDIEKAATIMAGAVSPKNGAVTRFGDGDHAARRFADQPKQ